MENRIVQGRTLGCDSRYEESFGVISAWQKRALESATTMVKSFVSPRYGTVKSSNDLVIARVPTGGGMLTIQVSIRGKGNDYRLEVAGIRRSGLETKRTVFLIAPDQELDSEGINKALVAAMG